MSAHDPAYSAMSAAAGTGMVRDVPPPPPPPGAAGAAGGAAADGGALPGGDVAGDHFRTAVGGYHHPSTVEVAPNTLFPATPLGRAVEVDSSKTHVESAHGFTA